MSMRRSRLGFQRVASQRFWGHASGPVVRCSAAVALLAVAGGLVVLGLQLWQQHGLALDLTQALDRHQARQGARRLSAPPAVTVEQAKAHNTVVHQLNIPWTDLWNALERHADPQVAVLAMDPDASRRVIRVLAEAKDAETVIRFAQVLADDPSFGGLRLRQQETNEADANRPVRLSFELRWRDAAADAAWSER